MRQLSGIGSKSRKRLKTIIESSSDSILTPKLVSNTLSLPQNESARLLSRWHNAGWLKRIKRGMYWPIPLEYDLKSPVEDEWLVADKVFSPGYIGGFSAVKHWDFTEQLFLTTFYLTVKPVVLREVVLGSVKLKLKTIKPYKMFGTKMVWRNNVKVKISDPSKTVIDLLDDPHLGGGMRVVQDFFMEYWNTGYRDIKLLIQYGRKMRNKTIFKRLGFLLEINELVDDRTIKSLQNKISAGYSAFDPSVRGNFFIRKWNLQVSTMWKKKYDKQKRNS